MPQKYHSNDLVNFVQYMKYRMQICKNVQNMVWQQNAWSFLQQMTWSLSKVTIMSYIISQMYYGREAINQVVQILYTKDLTPCGTDGPLLLSGIQLLVTLTLTLDRVIRHTIVHHSSISMYIPNFIEIGKKTFFLDGLTAGTAPSSRSRDTKTRTNFKNPARSNLDIVL